MRSSYTLTSENGGLTPSGNGSVYLLGGGPAGPATISNSTAAGTLTAVTDGDYLLGLNAAGTFVRKVLKSSIITTDASLLTSGTLADARLSSNVPLKGAANVFTASQTVGNYRLNVGGLAAAASFHTAVDSGVLVKASSGRSLLEVHAPDDTARMILQQISGNFGGYLTTTNYALTIGASKSQIRFGTQFSGATATNTLFVNPDGGNDANTPIMAVLNSASQTADTLQLWGVSSTSTQRAQAAVNSGWADSTDATRSGQLSLAAHYTGTAQTGLTLTANSDGLVRHALSGSLRINSAGITGGTTSLSIKPGSDSNPNAILVERRDNTSTVFSVSGTGDTFTNKLQVGGTSGLETQAEVTNGSAPRIVLLLKAANGQSANVLETQNYQGVALGAKITSAGEFSNTGGYSNSEKFGAGAALSANGATAFGYGSSAALFATAIGYGTVAPDYAVAVGRQVSVTTQGAAIGVLITGTVGVGAAVGTNLNWAGYNCSLVGQSLSSTGSRVNLIGSGITHVGDRATVYGQGDWTGQDHRLVGWLTSSTDGRPASAMVTSWADATDATRTGQLSLSAYYTGTLQTGMTITASGSYGAPDIICSAGYFKILNSLGTVLQSGGGSHGGWWNTCGLRLGWSSGGDGTGFNAFDTSGNVVIDSRANSSLLVVLAAQSSTTLARPQGSVSSAWAVSTDIGRTGRTMLSAYYETTAQEGIRVEANSGGARISFYGQTAVARASVAADATDLATAITLVNDLKAKLVALGLVS